MHFSPDEADGGPQSDVEDVGDDGATKEAAPKKRGRRAGTTNKKPQPNNGEEKKIGEVSQVGLFKKWVLFRYADDIYATKKHEKEGAFPLLCGLVTAIAEKEPSISKLKLKRCTGDAGDLTEPWALCIERHDFDVQATGDPKKPFQLRRKPYGLHPAVHEHEKKNSHSSYHQSFELKSKLVQKWGSKSVGKWQRNYTFLDFNNPEHKFVLLHEDAKFTSLQYLHSSTLKDLFRNNDPFIVKELNNTTEEFKGVSRNKRKKKNQEQEEVPAPTSAASSSSSSSAIPKKTLRTEDDESESDEGEKGMRTPAQLAAAFGDDDDPSEGILSDSEEQMYKDGLPIEDFCRARKLPNEELFREALAREFEAVQHQQVSVYVPGSSSSSSSSSGPTSSSNSCSSSSAVPKSKSTKKVVLSDDE